MPAAASPERSDVVVVGAGASGTLTAIHLLRTAARRGTALRLTLLDPTDRWGRGVAFGTTEDAHLLNVPASGMSALPEDPGHFVSWRARETPHSGGDPGGFVPRRQYGLYLDDLLTDAVAAGSGPASIQHVRARATGLRRTPQGISVATGDGQEVHAGGAVVATGLPQVGHGWAPESLRSSAFFVDDPWRTGALDVVRRDHAGPADVLVVGTGLTMVDVALSLAGPGTRPDRRLVGISRSGLLPRAHTPELKLATIPDVSDWAHDLAGLRDDVARHVRDVAQATGDWRPAVDGLRFQASHLWQRLGEADRAEFLRTDAGAWNVVRHRMAPASATVVRAMREAGRLTIRAAEVMGAELLPRGGLLVTLSDGSSHEVGWVVNCTGPRSDIRDLGDPLLDDLLRSRAGVAPATIATAGMGFRTVRGRLLDSAGTTDSPVWTLGALRRGELWESTAVPEIRSQALALAEDVLDAVAPLPRRLSDGRLVSGHHPVARPRDPLGLPLSTTAEAASAFNAGLDRVMTMQFGAEELLVQATQIDPGFALAHAALAMLGHEAGADTDVRASVAAAQEAVRRRGDAREASFVDVVSRRVADVRDTGARALLSHIASHPRDVLAVSAAVPTIAFSGVTDVQREAWDLVEGLAPAYGDHWWYISLLAFTRQDQGRFDEAGLLAESALSCEPSSGHAVHAQTHVMYETGQHDAGRTWLDHWVTASGRAAAHRAHFSWHAALHELALGDTEAVRHRYYSQLAPPTVCGVRALVDSASLLWRWRVTTSDWDRAAGSRLAVPPAFGDEGAPPPIDPVLEVVGDSLILRPKTPFVALHAALALAADSDVVRLRALRQHCASADAVTRTVIVTVCDALVAVVEERWSDAVPLLVEVLPVLVRAGGSAAQRDVVEETLLYCLVSDGRSEEALRILDSRLDRRQSPLDGRRRAALERSPQELSLAP